MLSEDARQASHIHVLEFRRPWWYGVVMNGDVALSLVPCPQLSPCSRPLSPKCQTLKVLWCRCGFVPCPLSPTVPMSPPPVPQVLQPKSVVMNGDVALSLVPSPQLSPCLRPRPPKCQTLKVLLFMPKENLICAQRDPLWPMRCDLGPKWSQPFRRWYMLKVFKYTR